MACAVNTTCTATEVTAPPTVLIRRMCSGLGLRHRSFVPSSANLRSPSLHHVITTIPLFALTQAGNELVIERAKEIETPVLINTMPLPVLPEQKQPS